MHEEGADRLVRLRLFSRGPPFLYLCCAEGSARQIHVLLLMKVNGIWRNGSLPRNLRIMVIDAASAMRNKQVRVS